MGEIITMATATRIGGTVIGHELFNIDLYVALEKGVSATCGNLICSLEGGKMFMNYNITGVILFLRLTGLIKWDQ